MTMIAAVIDAPPRRREVRRRANGRVPPPPPPTGDGDDGEHDPRRRRPILDNARLAVLFFIGAEVMFFAGLISAYLVLRLAAPVWPPPLQPRLPVLVTGLNTLVLLASSLAMVWAGRARARGDGAGLVRWLGATAALGAVFLLVQGYEWVRLVHFGLTLSSGAYGSTFYTLIGAHAAHVVGALVWLAVIVVLASGGRFAGGRTAAVRACAIYWHFVVGLWPILYVTVYLL
jgi:heme/copper-type cytochrome/quinol oxidase subunit 3